MISFQACNTHEKVLRDTLPSILSLFLLPNKNKQCVTGFILMTDCGFDAAPSLIPASALQPQKAE